MIEDTTAASFPMREAAVGLGPVGEDYTRGFWLHSTLAVRWQGHPEGRALCDIGDSRHARTTACAPSSRNASGRSGDQCRGGSRNRGPGGAAFTLPATPLNPSAKTVRKDHPAQ